MSKSQSPDASCLETSKKSGTLRGGNTDASKAPTATDNGKTATVTDVTARGGGTTDAGRGTAATDTEYRQSNIINTSFALPTQQQHPSLSLVQTRSRKRNGARTLYVPIREDAEEDASNVSRGRANDSMAPETKGNGQLVVVDDKDDMKLSALVENVSNTISSVPIQKLTKRPAVIAASIFLYLLLINIFALTYADQHAAALLEKGSTRNGELLSLSSSLYFQLEYFTEMSERIKEDMEHAPAVNLSTAADLKYALEKMEHLRELFNHSVAVLHSALEYKGKVEDIAFLIEMHAMYDKRIKVAAEEEMLWFQSARLWQNSRQKFVEQQSRVIHFFDPSRRNETAAATSDEKHTTNSAKKDENDAGDLYFNKGEEQENTFLRDVSVNRHRANGLSFKESFRMFLNNKFAVALVLGLLLILFFRS